MNASIYWIHLEKDTGCQNPDGRKIYNEAFFKLSLVKKP